MTLFLLLLDEFLKCRHFYHMDHLIKVVDLKISKMQAFLSYGPFNKSSRFKASVLLVISFVSFSNSIRAFSSISNSSNSISSRLSLIFLIKFSMLFTFSLVSFSSFIIFSACSLSFQKFSLLVSCSKDFIFSFLLSMSK